MCLRNVNTRCIESLTWFGPVVLFRVLPIYRDILFAVYSISSERKHGVDDGPELEASRVLDYSCLCGCADSIVDADACLRAIAYK